MFVIFVKKKKMENDTKILKICMCCVLPTGEATIFSKSVYLYIHPMTGLYIEKERERERAKREKVGPQIAGDLDTKPRTATVEKEVDAERILASPIISTSAVWYERISTPERA